jgi:hypothetical protein
MAFGTQDKVYLTSMKGCVVIKVCVYSKIHSSIHHEVVVFQNNRQQAYQCGEKEERKKKKLFLSDVDGK